jgi:hypothetical protein
VSGRDLAARWLVVVAAALLVAALLLGYAWRVLFDSEQFANRAGAALQDTSVRTVVAERVTDGLVLANEPDLIAARPIVASAVSGLVGGDAFAGLFRRAVRDVHRSIFAGDEDTLTLTLVDVGTVAAAALQQLRPELAAELEERRGITVLERRVGTATADLTRVADDLRMGAFVLAGLALVAAAAALLAGRDRRRTVARLGIGVAAAGVVLVVGGAIVRAVVLARVDDPDRRSAATAVWDAFLADLRGLGWVVAAVGVVVAAAAASLIRPGAIGEWLRRALQLLTTEPRAAWLRVARGAALIGVGVLAIAEPATVLQLGALLAGLAVLYSGVEAILRVTTYRPPERTAQPAPPSRRGRTVAVAAIAALLVAGAVGAFAAGGGIDEPEAAIDACNGHRELCDRALDEVVLPATHNSMSVPLPGWFSALQERPIAGQLEDGIRGLLLDTHYADRLANGRTRTYFGSDADLRRAIEQDGVSRRAVEAGERLRERIGFRGTGERGIYLCHTFCELGATPLADVLDDIREFLVTHPREVVVVVNQDGVTPEDFVAAVEAAGLDRYAFAGPADTSLRTMIEDDTRLVLLAENRAGGAPWYRLAYERLVQETPFRFDAPSELTDPAGLEATCRPNRGAAGAPLFLVNHWINTDPAPRPSHAETVNAYEPLLRRARTCARIRSAVPNLLAVDFYGRGDLFRVVDTLNGL